MSRQKGFKLTEETRRRMSENHADFSGKNNPMYGKRGENNPMYGVHRFGKEAPMFGKHQTIYQKERARESNIGRIKTEETKQKLREKALIQFKNGMPQETKIKIGINQKRTKDGIEKMRRLGKTEFYKHFGDGMKGKKHDPKSIEKMREKRSKQIFPIKDTSIEQKIQNFLKELKMEFYTHQYIHIEHGYQCDIFIPSKNLVIECFGDYWHKIPYGNPLDSLRCQELRAKGYRVLVFWEKEIKVMELNDFKGAIKT